MEQEHSEVSPSNLERVKSCTGSVRLIRTLKELGRLPKEIQSKDALAGSSKHRGMWDDKTFAKLPPADQRTVMAAREALAKIYSGKWRFESRIDIWPSTIKKNMGGQGGKPLMWGWMDAVAIEGEVAHLFDAKMGWGGDVTPIPRNLQMKSYATGLLQAPNGVKKVIGYLFIPMRQNRPQEWEYEELDFVPGLERLIAKTEATEMNLNPSEHCRYCPALAACPAARSGYAEMALEQSEKDVMGRYMEMITSDNVGGYYRKMKVVEQMIKKVKARINDVVKAAGGEADGVSIKVQDGNRFLPDNIQAYNEMADLVSPEEFIDLGRFSIGDLCDLYKRKGHAAGVWDTLKQGELEFYKRVTMERGRPIERMSYKEKK